MKKLTPEEVEIYFDQVREALITNKDWRAGQAMFNVLHKTRLDLAESVRGTTDDPFYSNQRIKPFLQHILDKDAQASFHPVVAAVFL